MVPFSGLCVVNFVLSTRLARLVQTLLETPSMAETELKTMSYFSQIGGAPAVDRIVEEFFTRMEASPEARSVRAMHKDDLAQTKSVMKRYFSELLGGPMEFSEERGHPGLRMRHAGFAIGPSERDAWMQCMRKALETVVKEQSLRELIEQRISQLADWVRNDEEKQHDKNK
jgi:hemoglobin